MATTFTKTFNDSYKKLTIDISSLDGGVENIYIKKYGDENYTEYISGVTTTSYTLVYNDGVISESSTEGDKFSDGLYYIRVSTGADVEGTTEKILAVGEVNKCLSSKISELASYDYTERCNVNTARDELFLMYMMLEGALYNATEECGNYTKAVSQIAFIGEYCNLQLDCTSTECC
ncbi:MAG: hypothetical protein U9Q40_03120 [Campylobacterota bacterium]|nr:hypothetical protein [Campylobacterota bacterium]